MLRIIEKHKGRVIERAILPSTRWRPGELELPDVAAVRAGRKGQPIE
jgi:hypothetical protein